MTTHSVDQLTCDQYGCPGCDYRHFHRTSDDTLLTEVPDTGLYTREQIALLGQVAVDTGAITLDR